MGRAGGASSRVSMRCRSLRVLARRGCARSRATPASKQHPIHKSLFSNATHISPLNPWLHLYYVVTGVNSYGQQVNPGEHLTREEALRLRTRESSWHLQMEDRLGTIEPGKLADLAVLDRDYFSVPDVEIKKIRSVLTVVDGKIVHQSAGIRPR